MRQGWADEDGGLGRMGRYGVCSSFLVPTTWGSCSACCWAAGAYDLSGPTLVVLPFVVSCLCHLVASLLFS